MTSTELEITIRPDRGLEQLNRLSSAVLVQLVETDALPRFSAEELRGALAQAAMREQTQHA